MVTEASEEQIATLRENVQASGNGVRLVRLAFVGLAAGMFAASLFSAAGMAAGTLAVLAPAALIGMTGIGLAAGAWYSERRKLGRLLSALPPAQQAKVLLPLRAAPRLDTRNLARSLLRDLRAPTELLPADAPAGRGDEPTP